MVHVCYFRHALALDERRVKFLPEYAWGGTTLPPAGQHSGLNSGETSVYLPRHTLEVWFAGTHSDVGGGNSGDITRSPPPLRWMAVEAESLGLRLKPFDWSLEPREIKESFKWFWHLIELLPFRRLTFARTPGAKANTFAPHLWSPRKIHPGQKIHISVVLADASYVPKARKPPVMDKATREGGTDATATGVEEGSFWNRLRADASANSMGWLELDLVGYVRVLVKKSLAGKDDDPDKGSQAVYDGTIEALSISERGAPSLEVAYRLLVASMNLLGGHLDSLKLEKWRKVRLSLASLLTSGKDNHLNAAKDFLDSLTDEVNCLYELQGHRSFVATVAISPDGRYIVSGSFDDRIRIWDLKTGTQVGEPLQGHTSDVTSVAISPDNSDRYVVSGSDDNTIRKWDIKTGQMVGEPLRGHPSSGGVWSVAISADGKSIISGSDDGTICLWDAERWEQMGKPLTGHTEEVRCVAISLDGKRLVSGSADCTIRIWDAEKGLQIGEPLIGHTAVISGVAITPDGKYIVSASALDRDGTIRIWGSETGAQVGEPLLAHETIGGVSCVTISSDGKYIVSGSQGCKIGVWDLKTRKEVNGRRIVSGSRDRTVRVWDANGITC
ncbi:hypothetical protein MD484_g253, partial [Candolleomyces efflorescens]